MNRELLESLETKHSQVNVNGIKINMELEDSMMEDFSKLFENEFNATVERQTFRAHGWYSAAFTINDTNGELFYCPYYNTGDIKYNDKYIDQNGLPIEKLFSKFHKIIEE